MGMMLKRLYELHDMEGAFSIGSSSTRTAERSASSRASMGGLLLVAG